MAETKDTSAIHWERLRGCGRWGVGFLAAGIALTGILLALYILFLATLPVFGRCEPDLLSESPEPCHAIQNGIALAAWMYVFAVWMPAFFLLWLLMCLLTLLAVAFIALDVLRPWWRLRRAAGA